MNLSVEIKQQAPGAYIVSPVGSLDSNTYMLFEEKITSVLTQSPSVMVFDMKRLEYLSSAGVRAILKARDGMKKNNGKITFMNLQPQIKKVFEIINALPTMQIFSSVEELDVYLDEMQKRVKAGEE